MEIIPAINTSDVNEAVDIISKLEEIILPNGISLGRIQIDINDGTFENIKTIAPEALMAVETKLMFDYHLMVNDPTFWIERTLRGQAERVIGQVEKMGDKYVFIEKVTRVGMKVGFALDFETPIESIDETLFTSLDVILLMSYPAGAGGKQLDEAVFGKIESLGEIKKKNSYPFKICLDGGITLQNIKRIKLSGVDEVAVTKSVIDGDIERNLEELYKAIY